jgi:hypothetical protein
MLQLIKFVATRWYLQALLAIVVAKLAWGPVSELWNELRTAWPESVAYGAKGDAIKQMRGVPEEQRQLPRDEGGLRNTAPPRATPAVPAEDYFIFTGGRYNEVLVGQKSVIEAAPCRSLVGWGLDSKTVKEAGTVLTVRRGPFRTADQARAAYEAELDGSPRIKPLACGTCCKFKFDGQNHDMDNALRFCR